jgi:hypothetical protein
MRVSAFPYRLYQYPGNLLDNDVPLIIYRCVSLFQLVQVTRQ